MGPRYWIGLTTVLFLLTLLISSAAAEQLLVPEHYDLEAALAEADPGDTVSVAPGTMVEAAVLMPSGVTLLSRVPYENSIARFLAYNLAEPCVVEGFLFTSEGSMPPPTPAWLGAIIDAATIQFVDCHFDHLYSTRGAAQGMDHWLADSDRAPVHISEASSVTFEGCKFNNNGFRGWLHGWGLNIHSNGSELAIRDCVFEDQDAAVKAEGPVIISGSSFRRCRFTAIKSYTSITMTGTLVTESGPYYWRQVEDSGQPILCLNSTALQLHGSVDLQQNTFVDNQVALSSDYYWNCELPDPNDRLALVKINPAATGRIKRNLFIGMTSPAVEAPATVEVVCNDAWDSEAVYWRGGIEDVTGIDGNISEQPLFCGRANGDYTLSEHSPAALADCGLMGAFPTNCVRQTPIAIQDFTAYWEGDRIQLRWELAGGDTPEILLERLDTDGLHEIYRGRDLGFIDTEPPIDGQLRYALGFIQDGERISGQAWASPSGERAILRTRLVGAVPNPFNPRTEIRFELATPADAKLEIFDAAGRKVKDWYLPDLKAGAHGVLWQGMDRAGGSVASGVYYARLEVDGQFSTERLVLLR